jgi:CubicO group peptidase (beta-lactamase class C family)
MNKILMSVMLLIGLCLSTLNLQASTEDPSLPQSLSPYIGDATGVIYAVIDDEDEYVGAMGYADKENDILADPTKTAFRIGSISKTFVAIAVLQLVDQGLLDLHEDITRYLPSEFHFSYPITLHHLLTHTAGFEDLISGIVVMDEEDLLPLHSSLLRYQPSQTFKPSSIVSYSNYGLALAGYIVERVTRMSLIEYSDRYIFEPLGMSNTTFDPNDADTLISQAYDMDGNARLEPIINLYPEGSVVSTAQDMLKYMRWCLQPTGGILSDESKEKLFSSQYVSSSEFLGISYTWNLHLKNGHRVIEKRGETGNFNSQIVLLPEDNTALFLSFNSPLPWKQIHSIVDDFLAPILSSSVATDSLPPEISLDIAGTYRAARSNFTTIEKLYSFLIPDRTVSITGDVYRGFMMNGESMTNIGRNYYSSPLGNVKFIEKDSEMVLLTDSALSYVQVPSVEKPIWQWISIVSYLLLSVVLVLLSILSIWKTRHLRMIDVYAFTTFIFVVGLVNCLNTAISSYNLIQHSSSIRFYAMSALFSSIAYLIALLIKHKFILAGSTMIALSGFLFFCYINHLF